MMRLEGKTAASAAIALLAAYALSYVTARDPLANGLAAAGIVLVTAVVFARSFGWGMAIVVAELVGGSLGRLFLLPGPGALSIRMGIFAVAALGTVWHVARNRERRDWVWKRLRRNAGVLVLALVLLVAIVRGLLQFPPAAVVADANGYAYLLLFPSFLLALREERDRARLLSVALGSVAAVAVLSLVCLALFTYGVPPTVASAPYRWVRDFGLGEVTPVRGGTVRVFFQAHVWATVVALWSLALLARRAAPRWLWPVAILAAATVALSFSRTLWLATAAGIVAMGLMLLSGQATRRAVPRFILLAAALAVLGALLPAALMQGGASFAAERARSGVGEAAVDSRIALLQVLWPAVLEHPVLGSGFGRALTYRTSDPRLLEYFPDGNYTTTAFEWGWLDFWLKLGFLGMAVFAVWPLSVALGAVDLVRRGAEWGWPLAFLGATVALVVAHVFSPWLNHPLGLGALMIATAVVDRLRRSVPSGTPASPASAP